MPVPILSLFGAPIKDAIGGIINVVDSFLDGSEKKLEAKAKLAQISADLEAKLAEADVEFAKAQAEVIKAEVMSESWLTANWRPILMLTFALILLWNWIAVPILSLPFMPVPEDLWELLKIGVGGYVVGRSVEKVAPAVAEAMVSKDKK